MSTKKQPSNNGEQDFGFLSSNDHAELTDAGGIESRAETFETFSALRATSESDVQRPPVTNMQQEAVRTPVASTARITDPPDRVSSSEFAEPPALSSDHVSRRLFVGVAGYAIALTLLFLRLLLTGRISLSGNHTLESLPDLRPLAPNEFRRIPDGAELPDGHVMRLGESRRFGDVVVTPVRLTREPLQFQGFLSGVMEEKLTTKPVLKLCLTFENAADDYAFPPFDSGLMSSRTPADSQDAATIANTFLTVGIPSGDSATTRRLNFLHTMDNNFVIVGQNSGKVLRPRESLTTFVAESDEEDAIETDDRTQFVWRVQFRKGVNLSSGNGVTTLIDIEFSGADIAAAG